MSVVRTPPDFLDLGAAEIHLPPPEAVRNAITAHSGEPSTYPEPAGERSLRGALARHLALGGVPCRDIGQVAVTPGGTAALAALVTTQTRPGGKVLVPDPGWAMYRRLIQATGRRPVPYPVPVTAEDDAWMVGLDRAAPEADALIWNSPHNPTGGSASPAQAAAVVRIASRHGLFLISDEVFSDLTWAAPHSSPLAEADPDRRAGVWSASKSLRLAGYRVGWLWASEPVTQAAAYVAWSTTMGAPLVGQVACRMALSAYQEIVTESRALVRANLHQMVQALGAHTPVEAPQAGMFLWLDISHTGLSGEDATRRLAAEYHVKVWPGERFGRAGAGHIRLNAGVSRAVLDDALERLDDFLTDPARAGGTRCDAIRAGSPAVPGRS